MQVIIYGAPAENPEADLMQLLDACPRISFEPFEGSIAVFAVEADGSPVRQWDAADSAEETVIRANGRSLTVGATLSAMSDRELPFSVLDERIAGQCADAYRISL